MDLNKKRSSKTRNLAGGIAHEVSDPHEALRMVVINNLLESKYYETADESFEKLQVRFEQSADEDPEFPLQLAAYARQEAWVRAVPQVILALASYHDEAQEHVRAYAPLIIDRADELCTVLAASNLIRNGDPGDFSGNHPSKLVTAVSDVIESAKFDEYQYAKYKMDNRAVSLHDVLNVSRPFDSHVDWAHQITKGQLDDWPDVEPLRQHRTWEDELSAIGQERGVTARDWEDLLPDMGLFARLRNLRNMLQLGVEPEMILGDVDDEWIRNSRIYPFRFYQARKALLKAGVRNTDVHQWLEHAVNVSASAGLPAELSDTLTIVDLSGSMTHSLSRESDLSYKEIGALFGAVLGVNGANVIGFADNVRWIDNDPLNDNVLTFQDQIVGTNVGSSTLGHKALEAATERMVNDQRARDWNRVVIFTDFQIWSMDRYGNDTSAFRRAWDVYHREHGEDPWLYMVDMSSYGEIKLPEGYPNVVRVQGWNGKILDFIYHNEQSMLDEIRAIEP